MYFDEEVCLKMRVGKCDASWGTMIKGSIEKLDEVGGRREKRE